MTYMKKNMNLDDNIIRVCNTKFAHDCSRFMLFRGDILYLDSLKTLLALLSFATILYA